MTIYQDFTYKEFAEHLTKLTGCHFMFHPEKASVICKHISVPVKTKEYLHTDSLYMEAHANAEANYQTTY